MTLCCIPSDGRGIAHPPWQIGGQGSGCIIHDVMCLYALQLGYVTVTT